jgi:RimJ/RimL family protein N-acetyltransferase
VTFVVRRATVADTDDWVDLYMAVAAEGRWIGGEVPPTPGEAWRDDLRHRLAERMAEPGSHVYLVAEAEADAGAGAGGAIVGQAGLDLAPYGVASLGMAVARDWRRRGVGSALVDAAVAAARERGAHKVSLQVWPHNTAAIALYRRAGFVEEGVLRRHYRRRNGELWDAVVMGLPLEPRDPPEEGPATSP